MAKLKRKLTAQEAVALAIAIQHGQENTFRLALTATPRARAKARRDPYCDLNGPARRFRYDMDLAKTMLARVRRLGFEPKAVRKK